MRNDKVDLTRLKWVMKKTREKKVRARLVCERDQEGPSLRARKLEPSDVFLCNATSGESLKAIDSSRDDGASGTKTRTNSGSCSVST